MNTIKFSHRYTKMPKTLKSGDEVQLLEVLNARFEELDQSFIDYDTTTDKLEKYHLPKRGDVRKPRKIILKSTLKKEC